MIEKRILMKKKYCIKRMNIAVDGEVLPEIERRCHGMMEARRGRGLVAPGGLAAVDMTVAVGFLLASRRSCRAGRASASFQRCWSRPLGLNSRPFTYVSGTGKFLPLLKISKKLWSICKRSFCSNMQCTTSTIANAKLL